MSTTAAKRVTGYLLLLAAAVVLCAFCWEQQAETYSAWNRENLRQVEPGLFVGMPAQQPAPPSIPLYFGAALLLGGVGIVVLERNAYSRQERDRELSDA